MQFNTLHFLYDQQLKIVRQLTAFNNCAIIIFTGYDEFHNIILLYFASLPDDLQQRLNKLEENSQVMKDKFEQIAECYLNLRKAMIDHLQSLKDASGHLLTSVRTNVHLLTSSQKLNFNFILITFLCCIKQLYTKKLRNQLAYTQSYNTPCGFR